VAQGQFGDFHHITLEAQEPHDVTMERHRLEKSLFFWQHSSSKTENMEKNMENNMEIYP